MRRFAFRSVQAEGYDAARISSRLWHRWQRIGMGQRFRRFSYTNYAEQYYSN